MKAMHTPVVHGGSRGRSTRANDVGRPRGRRSGGIGAAPDAFTVGLFVPLSGAAGIWGPTCLACGEMAADEINRAGGFYGREVRLTVVDAGAEPDLVADAAGQLLASGGVDAIVGMHISAVRNALTARLDGYIPYIYTPLYEGGERTPNCFAIGETPDEQLQPAIAWLSARRHARRWFLLGNDYIWPRASHAQASRFIAGLGGAVVDDVYMPLGSENFDSCLDRIARSGADAVLVSLVGQDSVAFNRAFGARHLDRRLLRLSMAVDENMLLAIGADNTNDLYVAAGYFSALSSDANLAFKERYRARLGERAPVLSALGQSIYEGFSFLRGLDRDVHAPGRPVDISGARGGAFLDNERKLTPVHLAQADGHEFRMLRAAGVAMRAPVRRDLV